MTNTSFASSDVRQISVTGIGSVASTPDTFNFTVQLEEKGKLAGELNKTIERKTLNIVEKLLNLGIEKKSIQALHVRFTPWVEYKREGNEHKGVVLTRKITVTLDNLDIYGKSIDTLLNIGITRIDGFSASNSQGNALYEKALELALLNAKTKASKMALTLGLNLDQVMTISEQSSHQVMPVQMESLRMNSAKSSSYQPGEMQTQAKVSVVFRLVD
ncbi:SIMPL domain-containing protein [Paraglaciecola sp.]|uniref:SIMPL domain-containing protein n=1 Tax=Paraglaciecola sp. TaxID=1920173 RepID=UPI003F4A98FF